MAHLSCFIMLRVVHLNNFNLVIKYSAMCDDAVSNNILEVWLHTIVLYTHMSFLKVDTYNQSAYCCGMSIQTKLGNAPNNAPLYKSSVPPGT